MQKFLSLFILGVLAVALTGQPGVTAAPPAFSLLCGSGLTVAVGIALLLSTNLGLTTATPLATALLLVGFGWLSDLNSLDGFLGKVSLSSWTSGVGLLAALLYTVQTRNDWRKAAWGVLVLTLLSTSFGLALSLIHGSILQANFTNPDCYAVIPLSGVLLSLGLLPGSERQERLILMGFVAILSGGLFLTASRSGFIGLLVGMAVFSFLAWRKERARQALMVLICAPLITILFLFALGKSEVLFAKWATLTSGKENLSVEVRLAVLRGSLQASLAKPLLGYGPGTFHLAYQSFRPSMGDGDDYMNVAHDDFAQVLVEQGFVGLALWLLLLGLCVHRAAHTCRNLNSVEHAGACAAVAGILAYSLGNFALPVTADLIFLFACLGLCAAARSEKRCQGPVRRTLGIALLLFGFAGLAAGFQAWRNNAGLETARQQEDGLHWELAFSALDSCDSSGDVRVFIERARLAERAALFLGDLSWNDVAVGELELANKRSPNDLRVLLRLATLYESQGRYRDAYTLLLYAKNQSKDNSVVEQSVERNLILQGDVIGAAREILSSREENPAILGQLLALLEVKQEGAGLRLLRDWSAARPGNALVDAAKHAGAFAVKLDRPKVALAFYGQVLSSKPNDTSALLASIPLSPPTDRLNLARRALDAADADPSMKHDAMKAWVDLMIASRHGKPLPEIMSRLEGYLAKNPAVPDLRIRLSEFYESEGQTAEARRVLRDGLDQDPSGAIHAHLGGIYERNGSPDIAVNYYEEALRLQPGNDELRRTIEKLQAPKVNFEDPTKLKIFPTPKPASRE